MTLRRRPGRSLQSEEEKEKQKQNRLMWFSIVWYTIEDHDNESSIFPWMSIPSIFRFQVIMVQMWCLGFFGEEKRKQNSVDWLVFVSLIGVMYHRLFSQDHHFCLFQVFFVSNSMLWRVQLWRVCLGLFLRGVTCLSPCTLWWKGQEHKTSSLMCKPP